MFDGKHVFTDFQTGEDTPPEQSYREVLNAVLSFAKLNAAAARKSGVEASWVGVLDKMLSDLKAARDTIDAKIKAGELSEKYWKEDSPRE